MSRTQRKITALLLGLACFVALLWMQQAPAWVEQVYSRSFYPIYSYVPRLLFAWIPFSAGDILYAAMFLALLGFPFWVAIPLFQKRWSMGGRRFLYAAGVLFASYLFFYAAWGINYYRVPLKDQLELRTDTVFLEDHLTVLERHIQKANALRKRVDLKQASRSEAIRDIEERMKEDAYSGLLSQTQARVKAPVLGSWISYFGVSGYFNPFTAEAHVNMDMPLMGFPFTVAHEISHQMGLGLEDECNFMAYLRLRDHPNPWYSYSAYFESVGYLLHSLYWVDPQLYAQYESRLSDNMREDMREQQRYWKQYMGWINTWSSAFYDQYLKHNNQLEGMARYGMVSRLIIALEKKNRAVD